MKNILDEKPTDRLHGRLLEIVDFVEYSDIQDRTLLDIGCGYGWFELNALHRGASEIIGIELSDKDLETARSNIQDEGVKFQTGSALDLPFQDEYFDTVTCWDVIEHLPKESENRLFSEVRRVLKRGGRFYLSTPNRHFIANLLDPAWWLIGHRHYSRDQVIGFCGDNNLQVIDIYVKGGTWSLVSILNMYVSKWIFRRRPFYQHYFAGKEDEEYEKNNGFAHVFMKCEKC